MIAGQNEETQRAFLTDDDEWMKLKGKNRCPMPCKNKDMMHFRQAEKSVKKPGTPRRHWGNHPQKIPKVVLSCCIDNRRGKGWRSVKPLPLTRLSLHLSATWSWSHDESLRCIMLHLFWPHVGREIPWPTNLFCDSRPLIICKGNLCSLKLKCVTLRLKTPRNLKHRSIPYPTFFHQAGEMYHWQNLTVKAKLHDHKAENERPTQSLHASWGHIYQFLQPRSRLRVCKNMFRHKYCCTQHASGGSFKSTASNENNHDAKHAKLSPIRPTYTGFFQSQDVLGQTDGREPTLRLQGLQVWRRGCTANGAIHPNCQVALSNMESCERVSVNLREVSKSLNRYLVYHGS